MPQSKKYDSIVNIAKSLFFKHGIYRVTITEICMAAQVSKVTFYTYFKSKEDLILFIRDELLKEGFSKFDEINQQDISFAEKVDLMTAWRIGFAQSMNNEFIKDVMDAAELEQSIKIRYMQNIIMAQEKGEIDSSLNPELIWLVTEKFNDIVRETAWHEMKIDFSSLQKQLRQMYFLGLITRDEKESSNE